MKKKYLRLLVIFVVILIVSISLFLNYEKIMASYALPSNWYENYTYTLDNTNSTITLTKYNGNEIDIEVPSNVTISGKNYRVIINEKVYNNNKEIKSVVFANGVKAGTTLRRLFYGCSNLETINFNNFDTSNVTSMEGMFRNCKSLTNLDLSSFDTSSVTTIDNMFHSCSSLSNLNIKSFNTSSLTSMSGTFYGLSSLKSLNISSFDTSKVESMYDTFNATSITEIILGKKTNLKIGVLPTAGNFGRGNWIRISDNKEFSAVDIGVMSTTKQGAEGTYRKKSNISTELNIDFLVKYKIEKFSKIDEFNKSSGSNFYIENNKSVYVDIPLSKTNEYKVPGSIELLLKNVVSDEKGNKYNLKINISNIKLFDLDVVDGLSTAKIEVVTISGGYLVFSHKFVDPETGSNCVVNGNGTARMQDVQMKIVNDAGEEQNGYYMFSAYDLDLSSVQDQGEEYGGYGDYSEGINFIDGFDTDNIKLADPTFLKILNNNKRITGSRADSESESSEFVIKTDATGAKFQWTAGKTCSSKFFTYYQPKNVEILKNIVGSSEGVAGIGLELYKNNELIEKWVTTKESKKIFLNPGKYTLKEVEMPSYFIKANDIDFYVDINDTLVIDGKNVEKITMVNNYKETKIIEKHIDEYSNKILDQGEYKGKVGDLYKTTKKDFEGYRLVKSPTNATGTMTEEIIEVIYYYRRVFNVTTIVEGTGGTIIGNEEVFEGNNSTPNKIVIVPDDNFIIKSITINGEEIEITNEKGMTLPYFEEMIEDKLVVVSFTPIPAKVIEKHIDEYSNKILDQSEYNGKVGDSYKTDSKEFDDYRLVKTPTNKTGVMQEEIVEVIYYYRKVFDVITLVEGKGGIIFGDEEVFEGNNSTLDKIVIVPDDNFIIKSITINGEEIEITNEKGMTLPYFEEMVEDKIIIVSFTEILDNVPNTDKTSNVIIISVICSIFGVILLIYLKRFKI